MADVEEEEVAAAASIRMKSLTRDEVDEDRLPLLPSSSIAAIVKVLVVNSPHGASRANQLTSERHRPIPQGGLTSEWRKLKGAA